MKISKKVLCLFGIHDWVNKRSFHDEFTQTITLHEKGDCGQEVYDVYLDECRRCKKRRLKAYGGSYAKEHEGLKKLKQRWIRGLVHIPEKDD